MVVTITSIKKNSFLGKNNDDKNPVTPMFGSPSICDGVPKAEKRRKIIKKMKMIKIKSNVLLPKYLCNQLFLMNKLN